MIYFLFGLLGLCFGSFGNVLICRIPCQESIGGRSQCPSCKKTLSPRELIPVVSFVLQGGKCTKCRAPIGLLYPTTELLSAIVFLVAVRVQPTFLIASLLALCLWLLLIISIIDLRTRTISDGLNIPFILVAVAYSLLVQQFHLSGPLVTGGFFGLLWLLGRGKWIGSGDVLLGIGIGALAGTWQLALAALFITYVGGSLVVTSLLLSNVLTHKHYVAFAPFLSAGAYAVVLLREQIEFVLRWYLSLL